MDQREFNQMMAVEVANKMGENYTVEVKEMEKGNGIIWHGLVIRKDVDVVAPVIYTDEEYSAYKDGECLCGCADSVVRKYEQFKMENGVGESLRDRLLNWEHVRDSIYPALVSASDNSEMLSGLLHTPYLDLAIIYMNRLKFPDGNTSTSKVTPDMLRIWGVSEDELKEAAMKNLRNDGFTVRGLMDVISSYFDEDEPFEPMEGSMQVNMYVLTNRDSMYGAAGMLLKDEIKKASAGNNLYIIPSSIHELLLLPDDGTVDKESLDHMVQEVNMNEVLPTERLSDHVYYYEYAENEIRMCA